MLAAQVNVGVDIAFVIILLGILAVVIWAIVDVVRQPSRALSGGAKAAWIIGLVLGVLVFALIGGIAAVIYLAAVRPGLRRKAASQGPPEVQWRQGPNGQWEYLASDGRWYPRP